MASTLSLQHATVRHGTLDDLPAITRLINHAYQVEQFFVEGDRTSERDVRSMYDDGVFLVLDAEPGSETELAGSIYVRIDHETQRGYFGLLSVAPDLQGCGVGRRLVSVAEALCAAEGCHAMDLLVVNLRTELPPWYRSLGYEENGTAPFPTNPPPKRDCHFIRMTKELQLG